MHEATQQQLGTLPPHREERRMHVTQNMRTSTPDSHQPEQMSIATQQLVVPETDSRGY